MRRLKYDLSFSCYVKTREHLEHVGYSRFVIYDEFRVSEECLTYSMKAIRMCVGFFWFCLYHCSVLFISGKYFCSCWLLLFIMQPFYHIC
jgi:hypothetical protein